MFLFFIFCLVFVENLQLFMNVPKARISIEFVDRKGSRSNYHWNRWARGGAF